MAGRRKHSEMPPKDDPVFVKYWELYIHPIIQNPSYRPLNLVQLAILCDLHVEYEKLKVIVDSKGSTYEADGRYGLQVKTRPEALQLAQIRTQIANYCRILGLLITPKPTSGVPKPPAQKGEEEWD